MTNNQKYILHIFYWCLEITLMFYLYSWPHYSEQSNHLLFWVSNLLSTISYLLTFYILYSFIIPKYIFTRNWKKSILYTSALLSFSFCSIIFCWNINEIFQQNSFRLNIGITESAIHTVFNYTSRAFIIRFLVEWFDSEKYRKKLIKLTKESQLTFLKYQISPHFLFNTLNTVYALSLKKSEQTGKTLNKLKEVIHYMELVEESDTITLKEEISYLESVIALHSLRTEFHEKIKLNIDCSEKCLAKKIHSMLSISFIENAFKHGRLNKPEDYIIINITSKDTSVLFEVKNSTNNNFSSKDSAHGIGIENVKQRLSILYPNYNCLKITSADTFYKTDLSLEYIN